MTVAAKDMVEATLIALQRAQDSILDAKEALRPVRYGDEEYARMDKLHREIRAQWYRVRDLLDNPRITLDTEPEWKP